MAIITDDSLSSASVNQELGYAQALGINKIPLVQTKSELGFLIYGDEKLFFTNDNFKDKCVEIRKYILVEGPKPRFSKEEAMYVQKSAHFRYEIKQHLDDILDSIIYRLQVVPEKRDWLYETIEKRKILFEEIFKVFNHNFPNFRVKQIPLIEKKLLELPLSTFHTFNRDFELFKTDIQQVNELPHDDLLSDEQDAFQKFNLIISEIEENSFDIKNYTNQYYDEDALSNCLNFLRIIEKYPKDADVPLTSIFRGKMRSLSSLVKSVISLEQEIDKVYEKFGEISLKDRYID